MVTGQNKSGSSDFEIEVTIVMGTRQPVFFNRENFDNVIRDIAPLDGDKAARAPAASKGRSELHERIADIYNQLQAEGFKGRKKELYEAIQEKFKPKRPPDPRTIRRALKPD
jgi:hypothetical protein